MLIASAIVSGLGLGSMYGLLALGFHVTHAVSRTVNFAQGSTMMRGAVLCFTFWVTLGWPLAAAVVLALAACALTCEKTRVNDVTLLSPARTGERFLLGKLRRQSF
jgi:branched-subunit amino acid ABC-type transport system permease component